MHAEHHAVKHVHASILAGGGIATHGGSRFKVYSGVESSANVNLLPSVDAVDSKLFSEWTPPRVFFFYLGHQST